MTYEVFKIVYSGMDGLASYGASGPYEVLYKPGVKTKAPIKGSKLFAFDTLEHAQDYLDGRGFNKSPSNNEIWRCESDEPQPLIWMAAEPRGTWIDDFWSGEILPRRTTVTPDHTVGVNWVILKERVA